MGTSTRRVDRVRGMASDSSASIRGDVRNKTAGLFMAISLVTRSRAVLFPTPSRVRRLAQPG